MLPLSISQLSIWSLRMPFDEKVTIKLKKIKGPV
jgi:hypothetical protein